MLDGAPARRRLFRAVDAATAAWIGTARGVLAIAAAGLPAYLILRPLLFSSPASATGAISWWVDVVSWPKLIWNTLVVSGIATATSLIIALPLAFILFRSDLPGRSILTWGLLLPACIPLFVPAAAILSVFGIRAFAGSAIAAGAIHGWAGIPLAILQLGLAYRTVDGTLEETARLDASWPRVWLRIDLPLIAWSLLAVAVYQTWLAATDITVSDVLRVRTLAEEVYVTFQLSHSISVQSLIMVPYALLFALLVSTIVIAARRVGMEWGQINRAPASRVHLGRWRWPMLAGTTLIIVAAVGLPLARLAKEVGTRGQFRAFFVTLGPEIRDSTVLAIVSALMIVAIVMGTANLAVSGGKSGRWMQYCCVALLAAPTPCLAIAMIEVLNRPGPLGDLYGTMAAPIMGQTLRWLPLAMLIAAPGFANIPGHIRDAARIDGCGSAALHWRVLWPMAWRFLALSFMAMTILVFGEVTANVLLSPAGVLPISVRFFTLVHYGLKGEAAAICFVVILLMVIPWTVLVRLLHRSE